MGVFEQMLEHAVKAAHEREKAVSMDELKRRSRSMPDAKNVLWALTNGRSGDENKGAVAIMAEIKRACPMQGVLADIDSPGQLAQAYEAGGASAVSVITQGPYFRGRLSDLDEVRRAVSIPMLYKDFVLTTYQIHEARAHGADMVLLIARIMEQKMLVSMVERVHSLGMTALVEVHSRLEALRALEAGARVVGVNARDYQSLSVDRNLFAQIVDVIPEDVIAIAESGVRSPRDVFAYAQDGADAILVGESLVTSQSPQQLVAAMVSAAQHPALSTSRHLRIHPSFDHD